MKKSTSLMLVLVLLFSMVFGTLGCEGVQQGHEHEFVLSKKDSIPATCLAAGLEVKVCACGERQEEVIEATGHNMVVSMQVDPSCTRPGSADCKCSVCGKKEYKNIPPTGHIYDEATSEPSRISRCTVEGCGVYFFPEPNGKHKEALTFSFTKEDEAAIDAKYKELLAMINAAEKYDPARHGYTEQGALADEYAAVDAVLTELNDLIMNASSQQLLAELAYYCDMNNSELEKTYSYMMDYVTTVFSKLYSLFRPIYDSCYRDFFYHGLTEEEIKAALADSEALSNSEYLALEQRNNAILSEFLAMSNPESGDKLPRLYAEFVENNNKMAKLLGYDNYLEYAYGNVYGRDYTYEDAARFSEYMGTYLAPVFMVLGELWDTVLSSGYTEEDVEKYYSLLAYSFFENMESNQLVNDYIDLLSFASNPNKKFSFSDEFNKLAVDGGLFRGEREGAFVTSIYSANVPIAYFGPGYDDGFTVVHEFGHYMNEVYTADIAREDDGFSQSFDLCEMHSQGNELLYLCYLAEHADMSETAHALVEIGRLYDMFNSIFSGVTIDAFEQAIYLNSYDGPGAYMIMADGKITYDEYDDVYAGICSNYGVREVMDGYWRLGMTITDPCYYISYSVSAASVLQLYQMADTKGFSAAKDAYLKLFTYTDKNSDMTMEEILSYAGLLPFDDEQLYVNLYRYFLE